MSSSEYTERDSRECRRREGLVTYTPQAIQSYFIRLPLSFGGLYAALDNSARALTRNTHATRAMPNAVLLIGELSSFDSVVALLISLLFPGLLILRCLLLSVSQALVIHRWTLLCVGIL